LAAIKKGQKETHEKTRGKKNTSWENSYEPSWEKKTSTQKTRKAETMKERVGEKKKAGPWGGGGGTGNTLSGHG